MGSILPVNMLLAYHHITQVKYFKCYPSLQVHLQITALGNKFFNNNIFHLFLHEDQAIYTHIALSFFFRLGVSMCTFLERLHLI